MDTLKTQLDRNFWLSLGKLKTIFIITLKGPYEFVHPLSVPYQSPNQVTKTLEQNGAGLEKGEKGMMSASPFQWSLPGYVSFVEYKSSPSAKKKKKKVGQSVMDPHTQLL